MDEEQDEFPSYDPDFPTGQPASRPTRPSTAAPVRGIVSDHAAGHAVGLGFTQFVARQRPQTASGPTIRAGKHDAASSAMTTSWDKRTRKSFSHTVSVSEEVLIEEGEGQDDELVGFVETSVSPFVPRNPAVKSHPVDRKSVV